MVILSLFNPEIQCIRFMKNGMSLCADCIEYPVIISVIPWPR